MSATAYVVLRTGKVLQYNNVDTIGTGGNGTTIDLNQGKNNQYLIAKFPVDVVERVEFWKPCKILRAKDKPKNKSY